MGDAARRRSEASAQHLSRHLIGPDDAAAEEDAPYPQRRLPGRKSHRARRTHADYWRDGVHAWRARTKQLRPGYRGCFVTILATALLAGVSIGLSIAAPIGPTSMLCVQRTLARGLPTGFATGFGVATVHLIYGALAALSGAAFAGAWLHAAPMSLASGLVLLGFSIRVFRRAIVVDALTESRASLDSSYCGAIGFGFLNPITPVLFATAIPGLIGQGQDAIPMTIGGVFLGSLGWWAFLALSVSLLRQRLTRGILNHINRCAAVFMACIAIAMMVSGFHSATIAGPF